MPDAGQWGAVLDKIRGTYDDISARPLTVQHRLDVPPVVWWLAGGLVLVWLLKPGRR